MGEEFIDDIIAAEDDKGADNNENVDEVIDTVKDTETAADEKVDSQLKDDTDSQNSIDDLASQLGWNKDHKGDDAVDAATYILRSREIQDTMRDTNKDLKSQLTSLHGSVEALKEHNENVYKADVKRMENEIADLKKEKREAVELADVDKVDELDEQIETIQKDLNKPQKENKKSAVSENPVYDEWVKDNQWYLNDDEMANYAETVAKQYEGAPIERVYSIVKQKVKEIFPEKFETVVPTKEDKEVSSEKPLGPKSPVERGSNRDSKATFTVNDLSAEQKTAMRQFVGMGVMTEQQYVDDIARTQEG